MSSRDQSTSAELSTLNADFMRLLMRHESVLRVFARPFLPDWNAVDEVMQEASITMWEKFDQLRDPQGFLPWAKVIVRYKCLSAIAKLRREKRVFSEGVLELLAEEAESMDDDEEAARKALHACMEQFSQAHRELLLAPYAGDGRVKEIAEASGKSANALYKLLGRLREKLANCVQRQVKLQAS